MASEYQQSQLEKITTVSNIADMHNWIETNRTHHSRHFKYTQIELDIEAYMLDTDGQKIFYEVYKKHSARNNPKTGTPLNSLL